MRTSSLLFLTILSTAAAAFGAELSALPYRVVDAEYSEALDRIVMVSASPNQLHIYDGAGRIETATVDLPTAPTCISVGRTAITPPSATMHGSATSTCARRRSRKPFPSASMFWTSCSRGTVLPTASPGEISGRRSTG